MEARNAQTFVQKWVGRMFGVRALDLMGFCTIK